jgi:hypothetical protein
MGDGITKRFQIFLLNEVMGFGSFPGIKTDYKQGIERTFVRVLKSSTARRWQPTTSPARGRGVPFVHPRRS